ncbi:MAG TPA: FAD binding domain-containing protein, partial [Polyangiales bacterium]|nr:FAD binding domain-containing protein [Polyangiales bacterium]
DAARCNKRAPTTGCDAINGHNAMHAVLGASEHCVATHPSDMCVALAALDGLIHLRSPGGDRVVPIRDFHRLPGDEPQVDTVLSKGELIVGVELPPPPEACRSSYVKVRERASYAFALVSLAALLSVQRGRVAEVRIALGGVAHKPWRVADAEAALIGQAAERASLERAADLLLAGARPLRDNRFKIELARRVIVHTLTRLAESGEPS